MELTMKRMNSALRARTAALATLMGLTFASAGMVACGDSGSNDDGDDPIDIAEDTTVEADTTPEDDTSEPDIAVVDTTPAPPAYPEGPYGTTYLETMQDLSFYDPWSGLDIKLSDYYGSDETKIILISGAAGWCTACRYEGWDLTHVYEDYKEDGLEILYVMYEDFQGKALWRDEAEIDADFTFMNLWKDLIESGPFPDLGPTTVVYPLLVDIGFHLDEYFDKSATPVTIMVRTSDMKIVYKEVGYASGVIETHVKTALYAQ